MTIKNLSRLLVLLEEYQDEYGEDQEDLINEVQDKMHPEIEEL